ncbi:hypothetical protein KSP40_PGU020364 [Platanthera guangdongensis]|uniref:Uncharacterized protein n=1 Tax=Platanthera guangdongensis TaxID=2320717 RepID=A0ABR2LVG1_9ASPA
MVSLARAPYPCFRVYESLSSCSHEIPSYFSFMAVASPPVIYPVTVNRLSSLFSRRRCCFGIASFRWNLSRLNRKRFSSFVCFGGGGSIRRVETECSKRRGEVAAPNGAFVGVSQGGRVETEQTPPEDLNVTILDECLYLLQRIICFTPCLSLPPPSPCSSMPCASSPVHRIQCSCFFLLFGSTSSHLPCHQDPPCCNHPPSILTHRQTFSLQALQPPAALPLHFNGFTHFPSLLPPPPTHSTSLLHSLAAFPHPNIPLSTHFPHGFPAPTTSTCPPCNFHSSILHSPSPTEIHPQTPPTSPGQPLSPPYTPFPPL